MKRIEIKINNKDRLINKVQCSILSEFLTHIKMLTDFYVITLLILLLFLLSEFTADVDIKFL